MTLDAYQSGTQRENLFNQTDLIWRDIDRRRSRTPCSPASKFGRQDTENLRNNSTFGNDAGRASSPIANPGDLRRPRHSTCPNQNNDVKVDIAAVYLQDQIALSDAVPADRRRALRSVRPRVRQSASTARTSSATTTSSRRASAWSTAGSKPLSLYASYSVSYLPSSGDQFSSLDATSASAGAGGIREHRSRREVGRRARAGADRRHLPARPHQHPRTRTRRRARSY